MRASRFCAALQAAINEVNREHGSDRKVEVIPCDVVRICDNGAHKDVVSGKFVSRSAK